MLFKKPNYYVVRARREAMVVLKSELDKLEVIEKTRPLTAEELIYRDYLNESFMEQLTMVIRHINKNVWFPKRFWRIITSKIPQY